MTAYDIFNGDADGISALVQLRLAEPKHSTLITGVKRDIKLVEKIQVQPGDELTVLDISLLENHQAVQRALAHQAKVFYIDHHAAGAVLEHANFTALINTTADVCTSLLVNGYLKSAFVLWAIVGAFGDNLKNSAYALAKTTQLNAMQLAQLNELGVLANYNAYGFSIEDLHCAPQDLYRAMVHYASPLDFIEKEQLLFAKLQQGYATDIQNLQTVKPYFSNEKAAIFILPKLEWARRINGVFSNDLANQFTQRAHAILVEKSDASFMVNVRAPLDYKKGAGDFCAQFVTGGGREAAAGINALPLAQLDDFVQRFTAFYSVRD